MPTEARVGVLGGCHLLRDCGQPQLMFSSAGYKEQYRYHTAGHPELQSAPSPSKWSRDAACERARNGVLPRRLGSCRGNCLTAELFFRPCFLFLQQACAILALKPLKQGITLEMPKQDDI